MTKMHKKNGNKINYPHFNYLKNKTYSVILFIVIGIELPHLEALLETE